MKGLNKRMKRRRLGKLRNLVNHKRRGFERKRRVPQQHQMLGEVTVCVLE